MRVKVACGAVELALGHNPLQISNLQLQPVSVVGDLFAHGGGRCTLTVGAAEHGHVSQLFGKVGELGLQGGE